MANIYYIHWNEGEAEERAKPLIEAGHDVHLHWSSDAHAKLKDPPPEVLVISLDRLPSHGRAIAEWFWEAKARQAIPIIFVGGEKEKVAAARKAFPKARFCGSGNLIAALRQVTGARASVRAANPPR
jgi:hypothetical protein